MTPTFHYILHLPHMLADHLVIFPLSTHERKHREVKRLAGLIRNTFIDYDRSLLDDITTQQVGIIEATNCSLLPRLTRAYEKPPQVLLASLRGHFGAGASIRLGAE